MKNDIYTQICRISGEENVFSGEPMQKHTTFRTGGPADLLVTPSAEELPEIVRVCRENNIPYLVIGNGSNLLVSDDGIEGVVIEIGKRMADIAVEGDTLTVGAGTILAAVAAKAAESGLTGLEFASGIPGSMGGAVVMNAGAYGGEMKDVLTEAVVLTPQGEIHTYSVEELDLSYRHSIVQERGDIVVSAKIKLKAGDKEAIYSYMNELREKRVTKQPLEFPSAGSTFKRPEGYFAGKLIQDAGLRGFQVGGAQVSEKHCGFVINRDHATTADIHNLMSQVQQIVMEKFGVMLEPEVKSVGR